MAVSKANTTRISEFDGMALAEPHAGGRRPIYHVCWNLPPVPQEIYLVGHFFCSLCTRYAFNNLTTHQETA
jgi:hypothetical protein